MKAAGVRDLQKELEQRSHPELVALCLRLAKFKKENKELLSYLLFQASDEASFIRGIQEEMDEQFSQVNTKSFFYIKKGVRKILRQTKTAIRYSQHNRTEVELLLYFCLKLKSFQPSIQRNAVLLNLHQRQLDRIQKVVATLHEDLQYDYRLELEDCLLTDN